MRKKQLQIDVQKIPVDMSFGLGDLVTCRLIGNAASGAADTAQMRLMRSPENPEEIVLGLHVDGIAALKTLYVQLGQFLSKMDSPEVH